MDTVTIEQEVELPGTPKEVYEAYIDSIKHAEFTCYSADIERFEGGKMSAGGDYITGTIEELVPEARIVQTWHASDFPEGHDSRLELNMEPTEHGTLLRMVHSGVPATMEREIAEGWHRHYWEPLRAYLGQH
ncbi:MAG: SRPBCC domain-containing protein [Thermoplasmata archaeon]|nr:MAG: SRPBCC domain-containing protein [Thermoplasmata archaeon]